MFVGESTYPGRIFKVSLDGTVLGVIGRSGRLLGQFSGAHGLACPSDTELYVAETSNWRVQKLRFASRPDQVQRVGESRRVVSAALRRVLTASLRLPRVVLA